VNATRTNSGVKPAGKVITSFHLFSPLSMPHLEENA
jgi:hypothetical protein